MRALAQLPVLLIVGFAAYRAARAIAIDDIGLPVRERLYRFAYSDEDGEVEKRPVLEGGDVFRPKVRAPWRTWLYGLFTCPLCIGFWITAGFYSAWRWLDYEGVRFVIVVFAAAGVQCFLQMREDDDA